MASSTEEPRAEPHPAVDMEKAGPATTTVKDDEDEFPSFAKVMVIMVSVYLSMFLVALVSFLLRISTPAKVKIRVKLTTTCYLGPNNSRHSNSKNHR